MSDFVESALRNCNAALQNRSMQALLGRSFRNSGKIKRHGNRSQIFGAASGKFYRNCPNQGQELAGFFREISGNAGRYPQLSQTRRCPPRRPHRHRCEYRDARGCQIGPLVTARGGLLKLLKIYFALPLESLSVADFWTALHHPAADTHAFKTGFHIVVGLLTAVFHVFGTGAGQGPRLGAPRLAHQCLHRAPPDRRGQCREPLFERGRHAHTLFSGCSRCSTRASCDETRRRAPLLLTSRPDWAAFIASLFAPAPREKP